MITPEQTKRRRGGQPGNHNAKNNRGNKTARGMKGNRGGKGAPLNNRNAYKRLTLDAELLKNFNSCPEAVDWIRENAEILREIEVPKEHDFAASSYNYTPEHLADTGQEYRRGFFCVQEDE